MYLELVFLIVLQPFVQENHETIWNKSMKQVHNLATYEGILDHGV